MIYNTEYSAFVSFGLVIVLRVTVSDAYDAEFGRIITYDNFDHFKVSVCPEIYLPSDGLFCSYSIHELRN